MAGQRTLERTVQLEPWGVSGTYVSGKYFCTSANYAAVLTAERGAGVSDCSPCKANVSKNRQAISFRLWFFLNLPEAFYDVSPCLETWKEWNFCSHRVLRSEVMHLPRSVVVYMIHMCAFRGYSV